MGNRAAQGKAPGRIPTPSFLGESPGCSLGSASCSVSVEYPTVQRQTGEMAFVWLEMRGLNFDPGREPLFIIILPAKATLCPTGQQDVRAHSGRKIGKESFVQQV